MLLRLGLLLAVMIGSMTSALASPAWTIAVHGGAGDFERTRTTPERDAAARAGLRRALDAGTAILEGGGSALDAVEAAVRVLEDNPQFNAGRGAVFTADGTHELDAAIMDGSTRRAGAVAAVTRTRNPVGLARAVMERSPHVFLVGAGADRFAIEQGLEQVEPDYFRTEERWRQLEALRRRPKGAARPDGDSEYGTVGAVARDQAGHLAAATSTGGLTGKLPGRVGDSPVIGAGTFADDRACAVSATGSGEFYIREAVGHAICARIRLLRESPQAAADAVQAETQALGGKGGVIVVGVDGRPVWSFNTRGMYRARVSAGEDPEIAVFER